MEGGPNGKGVLLIYAPSIADQTVLHFSWGPGKNCALRNYRDATTLPETIAMLTSEVATHIKAQRRFPRTHTAEIETWRRYTENFNSDLGLT